MVTKISCLILSKRRNSLRKERRVRLANGIDVVVIYKSRNILSSIMSAIEKQRHEDMDMSLKIKSLAIYFVVTGTMATGFG